MLNRSNTTLRLPLDFRRSLQSFAQKRDVLKIMRKGGLTTVCEEARCPNIGECFSNKTATFMIMGDTCTRRCNFCSVKTGRPGFLNKDEPQEVAAAAQALGLDHIVITSVDRDELSDHGANHFVSVVKKIKEVLPTSTIELLVPDFRGKKDMINLVLNSPVDVFGHNIETVHRLYKKLRPQSDFLVTQNVLKQASNNGRVTVKSGMMVGVGETDSEVLANLDLLMSLGVQIVTIGQYLRPSLKHWPVARYVGEDSYKLYVKHGLSLGLKNVFAGPFVRSSYHAKEAWLGLN
jgi:lipoyl synthase